MNTDRDQLLCTRETCGKMVHISRAIWKNGEPLCSKFCFDQKFKTARPDNAPTIVPLQETK